MKRLLTIIFLLVIGVSRAQQAYYNDVNLTKRGLELKDELTDKIIRTHVNLLRYTPGIWEASKITDVDPDNLNNVLLIYGFEAETNQNFKNDRSRDKNHNGGKMGAWNREHVYPKSLGIPNLGTEGPGADAHHLRPSDMQRNASRSNRRFAEGKGNSQKIYVNWYPGDAWKGDVARMLMYMYLHYGKRCLPSNVAVGETNKIDRNMVDLLLDWNAEDPVSAVEDQRNEYHDSNAEFAQGNRNPFIDEPYLATLIWGGQEAENRWGLISTKEREEDDFAVQFDLSNALIKVRSSLKIDQITIYDAEGNYLKLLKNSREVSTADFSPGIYFLTIEAGNKRKLVKLSIK